MANESAALKAYEDTRDARALAQTVAEAAWERKALGLEVLDMAGLVDYTDYIVLCSGSSDRHVLAIAESIEGVLRPAQIRPIGIEGKSRGRWVLMDYGDVVVHIFLDSERDVYGLESLWVDAPALPLEVPPGLERPMYR